MSCPSLSEITTMLKHKNMLARKTFVLDEEQNRVVIDQEPLITEAKRLFGKLQLVDESLPPPSNAYRAVATSVPGLLACMHLHYYRRGLLKNEIVALEGPGGIGKTAVAYYLVKMIGGIIVQSEDELVEALESLIAGPRWVPILVLDDIASIINKYWYMSRDERRWSYIFRLIEYSKDWTGVIMFTAREFGGAAKRFRELSTMVGTMQRIVLHQSFIVDIVAWRRPGRKLPTFLDVLWPGLRMPPEEWQRLIEKRRRRALELLERFKEARHEEN